MSTQLQLRKGNTAQTQVFTGAVAEVTVDTDQDTVVVHDGVTVGGHYIASSAQLSENVSSLQGINTTQNTNITSVNQYAASAYNKANTGGTFSDDVIVSQNLTVSGNLIVQGNTIINETTINATSISTNDLLLISNTTNATAPNTGALLIDGGASIDKNLFLGEKLVVNQAYDYGTGRIQLTGNTFVVGDVVGLDFHAQGGTNFYRQSINIANTSVWNYTNATPIANSSVAPDFTDTGVKINEGTSNNWHGIETVNSVNKFRDYTHSIYAKAGERNYLFVRFNTGAEAHVTFDLSNGTYTQEANSSIQWIGMSDAGNGWYRCSTSVNTGDSESLTILTGPTITPGLINDQYQGINGYGVQVWHPQLEYGRRPSQFTPTANSTIQQENDVVVDSGTLIARQGEIVSLNVGSQSIAGTLQVDGNLNTDGVTANGQLHVLNTQESLSNSTGALVVDGGVGVKGNVYFGAHGSILDTADGIELKTIANETIVLRAFNIPFTFNSDGTFKLPSGGDVVDNSGTSVTTLQGVTNRGPSTTNQVSLTGARASSNVDTGDLVVDGGVGIAGNVYSGAIYTDNYYTTDKVPLIQPVNQFAQNAYNKANSAFTSSNNVNQFAQEVYASSNAVNQYAQSAYGYANTEISRINGVNIGQNTTITQVNQFTQSSYDTANGANGLAQSAYDYANTEISRINGIDVDQNTTITQVNQFAAAAYDTANGANGLAQGAYNTANNALTGASFSGTANSVIATNSSGSLYNTTAQYIAANNTLISANVNVTSAIQIGGIATISGYIVENVPAGSLYTLDSFPTSQYRAVIYKASVNAVIGYQYHEFVIIHDDITPTVTIIAESAPTGVISSYSATIVDGIVYLQATSTSLSTYTFTREGQRNTGSNILPSDLLLVTADPVDLETGIAGAPTLDLNS